MSREFINEECPKCKDIMIKFLRPKADFSGFYWEYNCDCGHKEIRDVNHEERDSWN